MPIDFFATPCDNPTGNCSTSILCCTPLTFNRFGISDANSNSRSPAFIVTTSPPTWDFSIENPNQRTVHYKAIDYCIPIFRTGHYNVKDDNSDPQDFSSDNQGTELIKRCEGFLYKEGEWILFFEIKTALTQGWLTDARRKFEETILSFKEHHPELAHQIIAPIVSNRSSFKANQSEVIQNRILKDKTGVSMLIQQDFSIS